MRTLSVTRRDPAGGTKADVLTLAAVILLPVLLPLGIFLAGALL